MAWLECPSHMKSGSPQTGIPTRAEHRQELWYHEETLPSCDWQDLFPLPSFHFRAKIQDKYWDQNQEVGLPFAG